ncbi:hypothetical protein L7F22_042676 [Adiantum nelumboides]|nr:hypothetical protein [Adiantum nelumboides]
MCNGGLNKACNMLIHFKDQDTPMSWDCIHSLLQDCTHHENNIILLRKAHVLLTNSGLTSIAYVGDYLIRFFTSCKCLSEVHQIFCKVSRPSVYTWHAIISAHIKLGEGARGFELFLRMQEEGVEPNKFVYLCVLKICGSEKGAKEGRLIQDKIIRSGHESDLAIQNTLVDMYSKCGSLEEAYCVFNRLQERSIVSWGAMIAGYAAQGLGVAGLESFRNMWQEGFMPNSVIFLCALRACGCIGALEQGRLLHKEVIHVGLQLDEVVGSAIIDMYLNCGSLADANRVFEYLPSKDVVLWSVMIQGYADEEQGESALSLYASMLSADIKPSKLAFLGILKACWVVGILRQGRLMHARVIWHNYESDLVVANALIDMYAKCGSLDEARNVFDDMSSKDEVSYNSMIQGYVQQELGLSALNLYSTMQHRHIVPNRVTFLTILKACSSVRALVEGREIHADVIARELGSDLTIESALVDMYGKCGSMGEACRVFETIPKRDVALWGTMFGGYAQSGDWELARKHFSNLRKFNLRPDAWIFSSILAACSHAGKVDEGRWYFTSMVCEHGIKPSTDHFNCMIDLFGRAGRLEEARDMFQSMPQKLDGNGWTALLTSCRLYGNKELGNEWFAEIET